MREWLSGIASPCQGEGRGFDPRLALFFIHKRVLVKRTLFAYKTKSERTRTHCVTMGSVSPPARSVRNQASAGCRSPPSRGSVEGLEGFGLRFATVGAKLRSAGPHAPPSRRKETRRVRKGVA